jgi:sulfite reductase (ferredoxin)
MTVLDQYLDQHPDARLDPDHGIHVRPREDWDRDQVADIAKFRTKLAEYVAGELPEDVFRVFRLTNGIYGQRQGGTSQMIRVKVPYGSMTPEQLEMMAFVAERYSRGWGHITTRQNLQFHFVELAEIPDVMEHLASVGLTSREACGDTVRNIQGCHLAGACPQEVLDITQWAEATFQHFVRNPLGQRLPRKFKVNFSGCATDCGQAMFNDAGVIAVSRTRDDGTVERGFRVYIAGGLGATPHPALALEEFTTREELLPTIESILRVFDQAGNRDNKLRARMKWLIDTLGFDEVQRRILTTRRMLVASTSWPGGIPAEVAEHGDHPAGAAVGGEVTRIGQGIDAVAGPATPVSIGGLSPYVRWHHVNVVRGAGNGSVSAYAHAELGDITAEQFRALAAIQRELRAGVRLTNRQNVVFRGLTDEQLPLLFERLDGIGMASPGAELARDVVACPGADTCNLAVTQSRGLAKAIGERLEEEGLADVGGIRINISGCTNSCGQHHAADIGFFGAERRANGRSAPGYQMLLGGYVGQEQIHFGDKALRLPPRTPPRGRSG